MASCERCGGAKLTEHPCPDCSTQPQHCGGSGEPERCTCGHHRPDSTWGHTGDCPFRRTKPEPEVGEKRRKDFDTLRAQIKAIVSEFRSWAEKTPRGGVRAANESCANRLEAVLGPDAPPLRAQWERERDERERQFAEVGKEQIAQHRALRGRAEAAEKKLEEVEAELTRVRALKMSDADADVLRAEASNLLSDFEQALTSESALQAGADAICIEKPATAAERNEVRIEVEAVIQAAKEKGSHEH